ncbi:LysE family translocator [Endozoicomonas sp. ISHI1]|uniref:LysE family translocator n=1 Tax=Endozoicomonas sp. ISHI1 TaxID=2825882 RepID=UPI00214892EF|nr:LysE family translocator [Endozoicomonas sp. ISHI1]
MDFDLWAIYAVAILVLTVVPGPSVLLCLTKSVTDGFQSSIYVALGSLTAITGIMTLSFTGLGVLISSSELAFNIIKWVGAIYLIYLGIKSFTSKSENIEIALNNQKSKKQSVTNLFRSGFIVGASNPKAIAFFTALFPQFIVAEQSLITQYIVFTATFATMELFWLMLYSYFGSKSTNWLMRSGRAKIFNKVSGSVFISTGLFLTSAKPSA